METIEEREEICAKRELPHNNGTIQWRDGYREGLKVGYHFGAIEQKAIDDDECMTMVGAAVKEAKQVFIDKAKEWFKYNAWSFGNCAEGDGTYDWEMAFECFRKAMEK